MKPGYKTTEFWISVAAMLIGAVSASGILGATETALDDKVIGLAIVAIGQMGYAVPRAFGKMKNGG